MQSGILAILAPHRWNCVCDPYIVSAIALSDYEKKSQETTVFSGRQKLTSALKLRPEK